MKKKVKKHKTLNENEKKDFAKSIIDGKMIKQAAANFEISVPYAYLIFNQLLEWKAEWKYKELENDV